MGNAHSNKRKRQNREGQAIIFSYLQVVAFFLRFYNSFVAWKYATNIL